MYFHHFRHLGRHLEFLKTLNDDRLSSSRILHGNALHTRIHQEKNFIPDFQVHRKYAIFVPDYRVFSAILPYLITARCSVRSHNVGFFNARKLTHVSSKHCRVCNCYVITLILCSRIKTLLI